MCFIHNQPNKVRMMVRTSQHIPQKSAVKESFWADKYQLMINYIYILLELMYELTQGHNNQIYMATNLIQYVSLL